MILSLNYGGLWVKTSKKKIKKEFVKFEIYDYPKTKREIATWQPLQSTTAVINHKIKIVEAIENALNQMKQDSVNGIYKEKLITCYFWGNSDLTLDGLALVQHVHKNTAQSWLNEFIHKVGEKLGLFDYY